MSEPSKGYRVRPNVDKIPCPFVASAYNNGDLIPEADGTVHRRDLESALARVGLAEGLRSKLAQGVLKAGDAPDALNLFRLRDSRIDHTGSTGIRDPAVDPKKLPALLAFGENGRMYRRHFARAANHYREEDPGLKGGLAETVEFTALLEVFGREDESGDRYLTDADIEGLWLEGRYPEGWTPRAADSITGMDFMGNAIRTVAAQALDRVKERLR